MFPAFERRLSRRNESWGEASEGGEAPLRADDHRTGLEVGNVDAVMDGGLDPFIQAFLTASRTGG
jgi:protein subunit release factor B